MLDLLPSSTRLVDLKREVEFDRDAIAAATTNRAEALRAAGASKGAKIAISHGFGASLLIDVFAAWRIGATAIVLSPSITREEQDVIVRSVRPALWVGTTEPPRVAFLAGGMPDTNGAATVVADDIHLDDPAVILMTSGTTSTPKGVVHTHRSIRARLALNINHIGAETLSTSLTMLPMHFGHGLIGNSLTPLAAGGTLLADPETGAAGIAQLGPLLDARRVSFMSSVPALWRVALRTSPKPASGTLKRVHIGSAPLSAELWQSVVDWTGTRDVVNMYGITETANWIGGASAAEFTPADGLVGRSWGGAICVRREDGTLADRGVGEVMIASPSLMTGYLDRADLTEAALIGGWFATGDTGEIDADGVLRLVGRRKNEINRAGLKVSAEEIDLLLERHESVAEACAFGLDDPIAGELVAAAVVAADGVTIDPTALMAWCGERIRPEAVPERIFIVDSIPRTDRGKINRDIVRAHVLEKAGR